MGAYRHQATWRQTIFNEQYFDQGLPVDDPANLDETKLNDSITLDTLDIQRVSAQDYRELRQYLEGAEPNEAFEGVRAINGQGLINALTFASLEDKAWALNEQFGLAACRHAFVANDPPGVAPFGFARDTEGAVNPLPLRFYARPGPARPIWIGHRREGLSRPYSFQLIAFDPMAYDVSQTSTSLNNLANGANTVTNPGNVYTKPRIIITFTGLGVLGATFLTNATTGQQLSLNLGSTAPDPPANGEQWVIDVAKARIYRDSDKANRFGSVMQGFISDMFLEPGNNTIQWSNGTGISAVRFDFRGAYS